MSQLIQGILSLLDWARDETNDAMGLITLMVGLIAIGLYLKQKKDHKRDAALLILQEIRYAEQKVRNYRTYSTYSFSEKLLPTNNWTKNIHLFVKDLKETEIDLISKFYSSAAYLDEVIRQIADQSNANILKPPTPSITDPTTKSVTQIATADLPESAKKLIEIISQNVEYVYNTPAVTMLRKLAERRWFLFF